MGATSGGNGGKKLSKSDPDFYAKIAKMAGQKLLREHGTKYFSALAASSHPRAVYRGGRPKKKKATTE